MGGDELSGEPAGGGHSYLLTQNCSHGKFKTIPSAGSSQAGTLRYEGRQARVERQVGVDGFDVGAEIEEAAHAADDCGQGLNAWKANGDLQALALG